MQAYTDARGPEQPDQLWLVEHEPVFTLGQAGKPEHVLLPGDIPVVRVDRGGQVTYHGPGQLVAYPLLAAVVAAFVGFRHGRRRRDPP
jgi:lipoyl(octanoyl) transferase